MARKNDGKRYEMRGFCKNSRGVYKQVKTLYIAENDPHYMAMELLRFQETDRASGAYGWRYEVIDRHAGKASSRPSSRTRS